MNWNMGDLWDFNVSSLSNLSKRPLVKLDCHQSQKPMHLSSENPSETSSRKIMKDEKSQYSEKVFYKCELCCFWQLLCTPLIEKWQNDTCIESIKENTKIY